MLQLLAEDQRLFQLLQVHGRAVIAAKISQLVAGQDVDQQVALPQAADPLCEELRAGFASRSGFFPRPVGIE